MAEFIETKDNSTFQYLGDLSDSESRAASLSPSAQKGGDNSFTCVGLMEWAAEQAGHNDGQGFIPNALERVAGRDDLPLLSPELLYYGVTSELFVENIRGVVDDVRDYISGFFDPVDFILTDPSGRRLGYVEGQGTFDEITGAFYSGDGLFEQILLFGLLPGDYQLDLIGKGENATVALDGGITSPFFFNGFLSDGERRSFTLTVGTVPEAPIALLVLIGLIAIPIALNCKMCRYFST